MKLNYETPNATLGAVAMRNGNISSTEWATGSNCIVNGLARNKALYGYTYDGLNRLTQAKYGEVTGSTNIDRYNENLSYNLNGDIITLNRRGKNGGTATVPTFDIIDNLTYTYATSGATRLTQVSDASTMAFGFVTSATTTQAYTYDANGNLTTRTNTPYNTITYNHLNLPHTITGTGGTITNVYDASGKKWQSTVGGVTTTYFGDIEYEGNAIKMIYHQDGRIERLTNGTYEYQYYIKDHLGNTRVVFKSGPTLISEHHFYPFGLGQEGNFYTSGTNQKYRYNGKELYGSGLGWYDYGARYYDACLGRWTSVDPLAEEYNTLSPYHLSGNNPVMNVELDGASYLRSEELYNTESLKLDHKAFDGQSHMGVDKIAICPTCPKDKKFDPERNSPDLYVYDPKTGTASQQLAEVTVTAKRKTSESNDNVGFDGWWHLVGPSTYYLSTPVPKRFVAHNTSQASSILSQTMSKLIPKKIKIGNTRRLYTHTVNGSKRYAATWGRFMGRWGTRFAGPVGVGLITYDFSTFLYNNRVPIQQGMEDRQNLIDDGLIPPR